MIRKTLTCLFAIVSFQTFAQNFIVVGKDTINRLDANYLKQGKWVFYDASFKPQVMCSFKNDTIVGNRIFLLDSGKAMVREPFKDGKEKFTFVTKSQKVKGWYDEKGKLFLDNPADSLKLDSSITYWNGVPAVFQFGQKNLGEEIETVLKPIKKDLKGIKIVIEFLINRSGMTEIIDVKLSQPDEKTEQKIRNLMSGFKRWQPAFNGWKTEPYKKQVVLNY